MKVLLTVHQFLPEFSSGTEVLTFEVARELARLGHDVRVLTGWPGNELTPPHDEYVYEGIRVHRYYAPPVATTSMEQRTRAEFDNPAIAPYLEEFIARWRPEGCGGGR